MSERKLWEALSAGKLGVCFKRQVPVGHGFIVDFLAPSLKLVVEVDGSAHERRERADARRDDKLGRLGYRVLRVDAGVVMRDFPRVVALVRAAVVEFSEMG